MSGPSGSFFFRSPGGGSSSGTGAGAKNYISNSTFETNLTTSWSLAHSTITSSLPVTVGSGSNAFSSAGGVHGGSAANGNLSFTTVSSGKLAGTYSGSYASSAATTVGDMLISDSFAIDIEDQAKVMTIKFYYSATTGTANCNFSGTSSNSFAVYVYDVTNNAWIQPAGVYSMVQGTGVGYATATFQTTSNSTNYQLAIINLNATAGAATILVDDIFLGPQTAPFGPAMSDWVAYTPTFTGFGTVSGATGWSRRVGDTLEVAGKVTAGTVTGVPGLISVGYNGTNANVTIDTSKAGASSIIGAVGNSASATTVFGWTILMPSSNGTTVVVGVQSSTVSGIVSSTNATTSVGTGATVEYYFTVPIVGWSSNSAMSSDTDTRIVAFKGANTAGTSIGNASGFVNIPCATTVYDTSGSWNGTQFVVPVSGKYRVSCTAGFPSSVYAVGNAVQIGIYQNTVIQNYSPAVSAATTSSIIISAVATTTLTCLAGDLIEARVFNNRTAGATALDTTAGVNHIEIERLSGPAVIAATESVSAKYTQGAAIGFTNTAADIVVPFTTKVWDTHNFFGGTQALIPVSGKYRISSTFNIQAATFTVGNLFYPSIYQNGAALTYGALTPAWATISINPGAMISTDFNASAGDTIEVRFAHNRTGGGATLSSAAANNNLSIERIGN